MRRPPIHALLGPQSKSEEQEFSAADTEKVNKTLSECLQLTEQVLGPRLLSSDLIGPDNTKILWAC